MKECPTCHYQLPDDTLLFCPKCGRRMDGKKLCANCNALIDASVKLCPNCGKNADVKEQVSPSPYHYYQSNKPLQGAALGWVLVLFLGVIGFILTECLGDYECKEAGRKAMILTVESFLESFMLSQSQTLVKRFPNIEGVR